MNAPPSISEPNLIAVLSQAYGLPIESVTFLPAGEDAYGYIASGGTNKRYYIKVYAPHRTSNLEAALQIPLELNRMGFHHAVAALMTLDGAVKVPFEGYQIAVYPFIEGKTAIEKPFDYQQHLEMGRILARLHQMTDQIKTPCQREIFDTSRTENYLRIVNALPDAQQSDDFYKRELALLLLPLQERLMKELRQFEATAQRARVLDIPFVLCHHDPTIGNIIAQDDMIYLIDWDGILFAPKERDLGHFHGQARTEVIEGYAQLAGETVLNQTVLDFYKYEWNIQEVDDFGSRILFEDHDEAQKAHDLEEMKEFLDYSGIG